MADRPPAPSSPPAAGAPAVATSSADSDLQALVDQANAAWTPADAAASASAVRGGGALSKHTSMFAGAMVPDKSVAAVLLQQAVRDFAGSEQGVRLGEVWRGMQAAAREHLLLALSPYMPRFRGDVNAGGERGSSRGIVLLAPELNLQELAGDPDTFPVMLGRVATEELAEQYLADRDMLRPLLQRGQLRTDQSLRAKWHFLIGQGHCGAAMQQTARGDAATMRTFQDWEAKDVVIPGPLFEHVLTRRWEIMQLCALVVDEFRLNVFGDVARRPYKTLSSAMRCLNCGATEPKGGGSALKVCAKCKLATYCSRECQKAHYRAGHKKDCTGLVGSSGR